MQKAATYKLELENVWMIDVRFVTAVLGGRGHANRNPSDEGASVAQSEIPVVVPVHVMQYRSSV